MSSERRLLVALLVLLPATAHAYIDPGTTGLVVGGAAGVLAWGVLALTLLRRKLVALARWIGRTAVRHPLLSGACVVLPTTVIAAALLLNGEDTKVNTATLSGEKFERVLLIGIDGVDPDDVRALLKAGQLPNLARLAEAGGLHDLGIANPAQSPVVWSTLATGQNPGRHGVYDFIGRDPASYLPRLAVLSQEGDGYRAPIAATAFWDLVAEAGLPATVVRWPLTFPPDRSKARVLAGLGVPDLRGGLGRYTYYTDRAVADDEEGRDKVVAVQVAAGEVKTTLVGPKTRGLTGLKDMTVPLAVKLGSDGRSAVLTVGKQSYALTVGQWSGWVDVPFTAGLFGKARGLAKFYFESAAAPFALYASAVEMHPDEPVVPFTQPASYAAELRKEIGLFHTLGMPEDTKALGDGHLPEAAFDAQCQAVEAERRAMLMAELKRFDRGLLALVFDTSDRIQHMTPSTAEVSTSAIGRYLIEFDRFLGGVIDQLPANTPLVLFSDHGFSRFDKAVDLNRWLAEQGYLQVDEQAFAQRAAGDHGELYKFVDWSRTRAYAIGFAGLHINVAGREGQGVVPAEQRAALAQEIADKLRGLRDGDAAVVHEVYLREALYQGPQLDQAPDLVVGYRPGYRGSWQSAVGGLAEATIQANGKLWQRDHIVDPSFVPGMFVSNFALTDAQPHVMDLAPTVLGLLGLPIPAEIEGRDLHQRGSEQLATQAGHASP